MGLTVTGYNLMVTLQRRRYISFIPHSTAMALSVVCFEVVGVKGGFGEGVSHFGRRRLVGWSVMIMIPREIVRSYVIMSFEQFIAA